MPDVLCYYPVPKRGRVLVCSPAPDTAYLVFFVLPAILLVCWGDALPFCSPLCLSLPPSGTFFYRDASEVCLHHLCLPFLVITVLTYPCKIVSGYAISVRKHLHALASYAILVSLYSGSRQVNINFTLVGVFVIYGCHRCLCRLGGLSCVGASVLRHRSLLRFGFHLLGVLREGAEVSLKAGAGSHPSPSILSIAA